MSMVAAIPNKPITLFLLGIRPLTCLGFSTSKFNFSREFSFRKSVSFMTESSRSPMFRGNTSDEESVRAFEQEAFIDGSSEFGPNFTADRLEATLNSLSKWLVAAVFGIIILWRHDAEAMWAAMGSVLNSGLSTLLKHILKHERPVSNLRSDPGMPSSHAQSIFFTVIFVVVSIVQWLGVNRLTITLSGLIVALGSYLSWLRVSRRLHTISQVVVGAVLGSTFSTLWFWSWDTLVLKAFISYLWVRIVVVLGAVGFCAGFLLYMIRYWVMDED